MEKKQDVDFVKVYSPPDEFMAKTIESLLEENGIKTFVKSYQVPMYDSVVTYIKGNWGEVLVRKKDERVAKELIDGFLQQDDE